MKKLFIINLFFGFALFNAQRHEIGFKVGTANIVGDIGKTNYIQIFPENITNEIPIHIGASYKRNFNPYQGLKFTLGYHHIYYTDTDTQELYRKNRGSSFSNNVLEAAITFEYNFFPINSELRESMWSPYIFMGISGLWYNLPSYSFVVTEKTNSTMTNYTITPHTQNPIKKLSGSIPFGIGIKYKFNYNWAIYGELTFRPTFTDDLDYNNIEHTDYNVSYSNIPEANLPNAVKAFDNFINANKIGNLNSKDWLNSISVGISYSFGRPPCYCN